MIPSVTAAQKSSPSANSDRNIQHKATTLVADIYTLDDIAIANRWYRLRQPLEMPGHPKLTLRSKLQHSRKTGLANKCSIGFAALNQRNGMQYRGNLVLPSDMVNQILSGYKVNYNAVRSGLILLVLEYHFHQALEHLERMLKCNINFETYTPASDVKHANLKSLGIDVSYAGMFHAVELEVPAAFAHELCSLIEQAPPASHRLTDIPALGRLVIGEVLIALGTLKKISKDDVILTDKVVSNFQINLILGERLTCRTRIQDGKAIVLDKLTRFNIKTDEDLVVQEPAKQENAPGVFDADLNEIQIKLVFEVGRKELNLGEIQRMAPGFIFDLAREKRSAVDIFAGSRRIGSGELVQINENVGVRVTRLFNNE